MAVLVSPQVLIFENGRRGDLHHADRPIFRQNSPQKPPQRAARGFGAFNGAANAQQLKNLLVLQQLLQHLQPTAGRYQQSPPMRSPSPLRVTIHISTPRRAAPPRAPRYGAYRQPANQGVRFANQRMHSTPHAQKRQLAAKSLNNWASNIAAQLQYKAFSTGQAWQTVVQAALPNLIAKARQLDSSAVLTDREVASLVKDALGNRKNLHEHLEGARFDKKATNLEHTQIRTKSGEVYELLNTLSPEETTEMFKQHGIFKQGKLVFGQGGFGKVRAARNVRTGQIVAVKKFAARSDGTSAREHAKIEAENFKRVGSGGQFVQGFDEAHVRDKRGEEKSYLFMELLAGSNGEEATEALFAQTPNTPIGRRQLDNNVRSNAKQYCQAVADLHKKNLFHEDIKLENFQHHQIKQPDGSKREQIKLVDYGLITPRSKAFNGGTPLHIPPEAGSRQYSARKHDAYSLGVTLLALKHGGKLWERPLSLNIQGRRRSIEMLQTNSPVNPHQLSPIYLSGYLRGETLDEVIAMLMNADPAKRISPEQALSLPYFKNV